MVNDDITTPSSERMISLMTDLSASTTHGKDLVRDVFYIYAPSFTHLSGGPIALHRLCHYINEIGHEAYIYTQKLSGFMHTPLLTESIYEAHLDAGRRIIAIYPEIVIGNPLRGSKVIRYLLNKPGARTSKPDEAINFWNSAERRNEFIWHFADEFKIEQMQSKSLFIPIVDRSIYSLPDVESERKGFLLYTHRVRFSEDAIPNWAHPYTTIDIQSPKTPIELAALYKSSKGLIVFERTGAIHEALFCGCPVVGIPNNLFRDFPMALQFGNVGLGWGNSETEWIWAKQSQIAFRNIYEAYSMSFPTRLTEAINDAKVFFGSNTKSTDSKNL